MPTLQLLVIKTPAPDQLAEFYTRLGFEFHYHRHGKGPFHYASTNSNTVLEIYPLPKDVTEADKTTRLGFSVDNLDTLLLELPPACIINGAATTEWGYTALIQDLDGRKIELTQA
ncbi:MAG: glyoxalase/bleomycin resistance/extradiol dioxygenase family protein [Chitinophaga sp.]|uniref:glyoxalase/bleomycin resistance/extradiol dioxygenase family protein n=1 Tax=Chitinophaga sp. TaxID=1869181 RepID=UPI001B2272E2|nr:glyoxalase/bleomycin resistance/extradiol dioxygenase family protein [Chitinophaga sp.]MBO9728859.1 glyoxalase/bleomycin resistance/extradiol dioxygenase family protein [Chitinophaga sp.]